MTRTRATILRKAITAALVLAGVAGLSANASAPAYAIAYNNILGFRISSVPFVPLTKFTAFSASTFDVAARQLGGRPAPELPCARLPLERLLVSPAG